MADVLAALAVDSTTLVYQIEAEDSLAERWCTKPNRSFHLAMEISLWPEGQLGNGRDLEDRPLRMNVGPSSPAFGAGHCFGLRRALPFSEGGGHWLDFGDFAPKTPQTQDVQNFFDA